jgi:hypothetical protein
MEITMMFRKGIWIVFLAACLTSVYGSVSEEAFADRKPKVHHRRSRVIRTLPPGHRTVTVAKKKYFYRKGVYYRKGPRGFAVVSAPLGAQIASLPPGYTRVRARGGVYYYRNGGYYRHYPRRRTYVVVAAPIGAVVPILPYGYSTTIIAGTHYYVADEVYYRPIQQAGVVQYEVVSPPPTEVAAEPRVAQRAEQVGENTCREALLTVLVGGKEVQAYTTACRQPDGSWRIVP